MEKKEKIYKIKYTTTKMEEKVIEIKASSFDEAIRKAQSFYDFAWCVTPASGYEEE